MHIILTESETQVVSGTTSSTTELGPVPLASGTEWVLPAAVLSDPAHAPHHAFLAALPQRQINHDEWPADPAPPDA